MSWQMMRLLVELGLSLHFFIRLRVAYGGGWWQAPVLAWVGLMLAPMFLQRKNIIPPAVMEALLWLWPLWLGFLVIFTVSALFFDISRLGLGLAGLLSGKSWWGLLTARRAAPLALALALALSAHSYYTAYNPRLKT
ncbi:hypothetical protein LJB99_04905, partial [Deltaproteobacteria bacterium OttesenSCG-928-K17]|nr:hypothetical protein [Deltaproteobacteria bacterium OttesenSCG-928-K17]